MNNIVPRKSLKEINMLNNELISITTEELNFYGSKKGTLVMAINQLLSVTTEALNFYGSKGIVPSHIIGAINKLESTLKKEAPKLFNKSF